MTRCDHYSPGASINITSAGTITMRGSGARDLHMDLEGIVPVVEPRCCRRLHRWRTSVTSWVVRMFHGRGQRARFRSRIQLAKLGFLGKLEAAFGEKLAAVSKASIQTATPQIFQSQVVDYQARVAELADALDSGSSWPSMTYAEPLGLEGPL